MGIAERVESAMDTLQSSLLTIGAGNMAHAILSGAIEVGGLVPERVAALDPNQDRHSLFLLSFAEPDAAIAWLSQNADSRPVILLAVKPQMLRVAIVPIVDALNQVHAPPCTFISILAGTTTSTIESLVRSDDRVVRVMPNTPAQLGLGMSAIATSDSTNADDLEAAQTLFRAVGETTEISEDLMDAFTAVAGSGPAYLFYLSEGMMKAAESLGFDQAQASGIVRQTILGSAHLLNNSSDQPSDLRARVTSKNGTTYAATTTLDQREVMRSIVDALTAARDRGRELAAET
jgi:pyrroline-5-carboxylate reductase